MENENPQPDSSGENKLENLREALKLELRQQQDVVYAVVGGLAASLIGALLWAVITVAIERQIGFMAIGLGLLVGLAVRYFGSGIDLHFGVIGAALSLFGCVLGNLFSQIGFAAHEESLSYLEVVALLNVDVIINIYKESFSPMDVLFYGFAAYEGFKFATRNVDVELEQAVAAGHVQPLQFSKYRLPLVIASFVVVAAVVFVSTRSSSIRKTYTYESGSKRAEGESIRGRENGYWETWWENGKIQAQGFYIEGKQDGAWSYFNEEGALTQKGQYKDGLHEGPWEIYYPSGKINASGDYHHDRKTGLWTYFTESGAVSSKENLLLDNPDGPYEAYFENGKLSARGNFSKGILSGHWEYWTQDGIKTGESDFDEKGVEKIINTWTEKGTAVIVNGKGVLVNNYPGGQLMETGSVNEGYRVGVWKKYYEDGKKLEEGEYKDNVYFITNTWTPEGGSMVTNGNGTHESFYTDGSLASTGKVEGGLRTGEWVDYYMADRKVMAETFYVKGKAAGLYNGYFENGSTNLKGSFVDGERDGEWTWFADDGKIESVITFVKGKKNGKQVFYVDGVVTKTETYRDGELVESAIGEIQ